MKKSTIIIIVILGLLTAYFIGEKLIQRHRSKKAVEINAESFRIRIIDSLQTIHKFNEIMKLDSLRKDYKLRQDIASIETRFWKSEAERQKQSAVQAQRRADSLAIAKPECEDIARAYSEVIDTLKSENSALSLLAESLLLENSLCTKTLSITEKQLNLTHSIVLMKDSTIQSQQKISESLSMELKKHQTWWNRNKFWVGGAVGVSAAGVLLLMK